MDEFEFIEALKEIWETTTKDEVHRVDAPDGNSFRALTTIGALQVFIQVKIGSRNGVVEYLVVLDPSKPVLLDQLVVSAVVDEGFGRLINRLILRAEIRAGGDPEHVCRRHLQELLAAIQANPTVYLNSIQRARDESGGSVRALSGGLPSLGKRH